MFDKCCCPSFLLAGGGPYLSILGVIFTDKFIVQRLTDIKWVGEASTHEDARVYQLARVFGSLRLSVAELDRYYGQVSKDPTIPALIFNEPHPRLFPYPTKFEEYRPEANAGPKYTEFEYIDTFRADPTNVTFLAKVKSSDQELVVKLVDRYGVEAHQLLADAGMAPRLLYCGLLDGKNDVRNTGNCAQGSIKRGGLYVGLMRMVVMEHINGKTADKSARPKNAREKTEKAIKKLHDAQFVFGDLRGSNVMFSGDDVFLIDFDWAGKADEARYPRNLSSGVTWPGKAEELEMQPILKDHDLFMLDQLFPK
jgi:hypothetical protein